MQVRKQCALLLATLCLLASYQAAPGLAATKTLPGKQASKAESAAKPDAKKTAQRVFMWKVTSQDGGTLYLVGSIHMVPPGFYPLPDAMEKQFKESSVLVLEVDETKEDPAVTQQYAMKAGLYLDGDNILNHISEDTAQALKNWVAEADPMTAMSVERMRPWFASVMIPVAELKKRGFDPKHGIDKHFLSQALQQKKAVDQLETSEFQLKLLSGFSDDLQDKLLLSSLVDAKNTDRDAQEMVDAWKQGDAEKMDEVVTRDEKQHPELKPVMEKVLYERNIGMADKIGEYLKSGKTYFVVVGAGHVVGQRGLVQLLRDRGFKVVQIQGS